MRSGKRLSVWGVVMNLADHPHGGGEGRSGARVQLRLRWCLVVTVGDDR